MLQHSTQIRRVRVTNHASFKYHRHHCLVRRATMEELQRLELRRFNPTSQMSDRHNAPNEASTRIITSHSSQRSNDDAQFFVFAIFDIRTVASYFKYSISIIINVNWNSQSTKLTNKHEGHVENPKWPFLVGFFPRRFFLFFVDFFSFFVNLVVNKIFHSLDKRGPSGHRRQCRVYKDANVGFIPVYSYLSRYRYYVLTLWQATPKLITAGWCGATRPLAVTFHIQIGCDESMTWRYRGVGMGEPTRRGDPWSLAPIIATLLPLFGARTHERPHGMRTVDKPAKITTSQRSTCIHSPKLQTQCSTASNQRQNIYNYV